MRRWQFAEDALVSLLPKGARRGSTWFGRMGDVVQQPPVWAGLAGALAAGGGDRGRRAAVRGSICYCITAVVANLVIKPLVRRPRPPGAGENRTGPITSSFPSGHAATDLAFTLAASQEIPALFIVLAPATMAALVNDPQSGPLPDRRVRRRGPGCGRGVGRLEDLAPWPSRRRRERRRRDETARGRHCSCHTGEPCLRASRLTATFGSVHGTAPPPATPRRRVPDGRRRCVRNSGYRAS